MQIIKNRIMTKFNAILTKIMKAQKSQKKRKTKKFFFNNFENFKYDSIIVITKN